MLRGQPGIQSVKVALLAERAVIEYDPAMWTTEKLIEVSCPQKPICRSCIITHRYRTGNL